MTIDMKEPLYRIDDEQPCTLPEFEEANKDAPLDAEDMAKIRRLRSGERVSVNLGACGVFEIERVQ